MSLKTKKEVKCNKEQKQQKPNKTGYKPKKKGVAKMLEFIALAITFLMVWGWFIGLIKK